MDNRLSQVVHFLNLYLLERRPKLATRKQEDFSNFLSIRKEDNEKHDLEYALSLHSREMKFKYVEATSCQRKET
jgi:hypothetical protein